MFLENTLFSIFFYYLKCFSIYFIWKTGNCFFLKQLQNMYLFSMHATSWLTVLIAFFIITTSSRLIVLWIILCPVDPTLGGPLRGVFLSFKNNTVAITIKSESLPPHFWPSRWFWFLHHGNRRQSHGIWGSACAGK